MATGYSGTAQARKLGLKSGFRVCLDNAPADWQLDDPPADLTYVDAGEPIDVMISFCSAAEQLISRLPSLARWIYPSGAIWIAWPRTAGGHVSDITGDVIREHALPLGIVDVKVAAIDNDWSGLRLVWRVAF